MRYFRRLFILCCLVLSFGATESWANKSGASPNVLSLPQGPGSLGGVGENVQANLNMGLMSYQIKVVVPIGRGGATPNPSISYSSSAGAGLVGIGWNFSAGSSIVRGTAQGLPQYVNKDIFYAGGELVKLPKSSFYRSRYEGGFMRYRWVQKNSSDQKGYWIAEAPNGAKMYYGANSKGEINLDAQVYGLKGTFRWELVTKVDANGNRVEYSYFKDGTQTYPDQISWVFDANNKPLYHLKFKYEARPDHISDGKPGFDLKTTKRIKEVQITSNGKRFRSYHFKFEDATGLSRLTSVVRYGRDDKKIYPVQFKMKYSNATFSPENSRMVTMSTSLGVSFKSNNIDFIDINGDGLPDVVDTSKSVHVFHINQLTLKNEIKQDKHDFPSKLAKANPIETSAQLSNPSVQMLDFNGDGFTDIVDASNKKIYINKGNSKWEDGSLSLQNFPVTGKDPNMRFFDYNGDKKTDVISSDGSITTYWVSDGKGNWVVTPGKSNIGLGFAKDKLRLIDINGDGLQDIVHITKNSLRYKKYLGYGEWTEWIKVIVPGIDKYELSIKAQFNDINGDGMADMVVFLGNKIVYFVNKNGTEFAPGKELQAFKGIDIPDSSKVTIRILDINGNGSRDIVWINSSGKVTYLELFGKRPNLMTEISNNIGQRINVEYGSSVYFYLRDKTCKVGTDKACSGPWQNKMPMPFNLVTRISTWASRSDKPDVQKVPTKEEKASLQEIYYHNGFYDGKEKKFRGFRKVESVRIGDGSIEDSKDIHTYDVGDSDPYFHGKLLRKISTNNKDKIYSEQIIKWKECPLTGISSDLEPPIRFICQASTERVLKEGLKDSSKWRTLRTEQTYDGFGNVIVQTNLGDKNKSGDEQIVKKTYITPKEPNSLQSKWFLRVLQKVEFCNKTSKVCAERKYYYDGKPYVGMAYGEFTKGNPTRVTTRKSADSDAVSTPLRHKFDQYGNMVGRKTAQGQERTITWDSVYHRFATKETIKLKKVTLSTSAKWDYNYNAILQSTGFNGEQLRYTYDSFGRLTAIFRAVDPADKPSSIFSYSLKAPINRLITQQRSKPGGPLDTKSVQCFDGLGRKISTANQLKNGQYSITGQTEFSSRSSEARIWSPYISDKDCQFVPPSTTPTQFFYDGLNRKIKVVQEDGTFSKTVYAPLSITRYDPEDNRTSSPFYDTPTVELSDGLGRLIEQRRMLRKDKLFISKFAYTNVNMTGKSQITSVTFNNGKKKTNVYDLLGQLVQIKDPDRGNIELAYDDEGNLTSRKEPTGVHVIYTYDLLNRILSRQEKGKPETKITYVYDIVQKGLPKATHLKGMLVKVVYPKGANHYSYDILGNVTRVLTEINGSKFEFTAKYDSLNRLLEETFPDGRKVTYTRDAIGRLISIPGFIKSAEYNDETRLKMVELANGLKVTYALTARKRPKSINVGDGKVLSLNYEYDAVGNVQSMEQSLAGKKATYTYKYDALYRLTQAMLGGTTETMNYTYDDLDNMTAKTSTLKSKSPAHIGNYTYDPAKLHAMTKAGQYTVGYDKNGCVIKDNTKSYKWDYLHRRIQTSQDGEVVGRTWYGPTAERIIKEERGVHTFYVSPHYEIRDGQAVIYLKLGHDRMVSWASAKGALAVYPDLAPATGDKTLTSKPDGKLTAADAWLHHASRNKMVTLPLKKRVLDLDHTKDYLRASLSRMLNEGKDKKLYYHADIIGSVRAVTDEKGQVVSTKEYYPYGYIRKQTGHAFSYGYMGTERDTLTGQNYFINRFMNTKLGRWQSPDPMFEQIQSSKDEFNSYGVVMANPIRNRDIDGNKAEDGASVADITASLAGGLGGLWQMFRSYQQLKKAPASEKFYQGSKARAWTAGTLAAFGTLASAAALWQQMSPGGWEGDAMVGVSAGLSAVAALIDGYSTAASWKANKQKLALKNALYVGGASAWSKKKHRATQSGNVLLGIALGATTAVGIGMYAGEDGKTWVNVVMIVGTVAGLAGITAKAVKGAMNKAERNSNGKFLGFKAPLLVTRRKDSVSYGGTTKRGSLSLSGGRIKRSNATKFVH